jgi:hypothetical protein
MHKLKPHPVVDSDAWIASFENAIQVRDAHLIHLLLQTLPISQNIDVMKQILLLTMDAEIMLCEIRQELVNQRETILRAL